MSFARAVAHVLKMEGGLVNNSADPGQITNFGISQRAYPHLDIAALTQDEAIAIYSRDYWTPIDGDALPDTVSFALLDFAVNSGVSDAIQALQRAVGVTPDGIIGSRTIAACAKPGTVTALSVERILFVTRLQAFGSFGKGWVSRIIDTAIEAFHE